MQFLGHLEETITNTIMKGTVLKLSYKGLDE